MDLADLIHEDHAELIIRDHQGNAMNGKDGEMSISFYGPDTDEQLEAYRNHRTRLIESNGDQKKDLDSECQFLADVTHRFNNVIYKGKDATKRSAKKIYREIVMIRAQASAFVGVDRNFMKEQKAS